MRDGVHDVNVSGRDISQAPSLAGMLSFIEQTEYDDIDGLKIDYRVLPRYAVTLNASVPETEKGMRGMLVDIDEASRRPGSPSSLPSSWLHCPRFRSPLWKSMLLFLHALLIW